MLAMIVKYCATGNGSFNDTEDESSVEETEQLQKLTVKQSRY